MSADRFLHFEEMTWPNPEDPSELEWRLRYGQTERGDYLLAASYIAAYKQLIALPRRTRDERIKQIKAALKRAEP